MTSDDVFASDRMRMTDNELENDRVTDQLSYIETNNIPSTRMTKPERMDHDHDCV